MADSIEYKFTWHTSISPVRPYYEDSSLQSVFASSEESAIRRAKQLVKNRTLLNASEIIININ